MLNEYSAVAKAFRMARDWSTNNTSSEFQIRLLAKVTNSRQYNTPTVAEVAVLITSDFDQCTTTRDIIVQKKNCSPKRISELHQLYMALQYPLLFPYGETWYHEEIPYHNNNGRRKTNRGFVTMREYYCYMIHQRENEGTTLLRGGRLFQQYLVDAYTAVEEQRLKWPRNHQNETFLNSVSASDYGCHNFPCNIVSQRATNVLLNTCYTVLAQNMDTPCMIDRKCSKHFPKPYYAETTIDEDGYANYRRRNNGEKVRKGKDNSSLEKVTEVDVIKNYLDCRYLSPCEAVWRMFSFEIHFSQPSVIKLSYHLPNQQAITVHDLENLPALLHRESIKETMFTEWFELNKRDQHARNLTYVKIPIHYVWNQDTKEWAPRKQKRCIGHIVYSNPASGERYYLRMLLNIVKGPLSFEDICRVDGTLHPTFKDASFAHGLINDDKEWTEAISEATLWASGSQLCDLFVTILLFCNVSKPLKLWETHWEALADDILRKK
ncbi:uncharacterized protein [Rutidosis leptorrhynchoides]|uniref:uncharacterized protein n=1 Tax=Rutidosis leptorrhynchoides TaxID=125765 RepID=UPI003A99C0C2